MGEVWSVRLLADAACRNILGKSKTGALAPEVVAC